MYCRLYHVLEGETRHIQYASNYELPTSAPSFHLRQTSDRPTDHDYGTLRRTKDTMVALGGPPSLPPQLSRVVRKGGFFHQNRKCLLPN